MLHRRAEASRIPDLDDEGEVENLASDVDGGVETPRTLELDDGGDGEDGGGVERTPDLDDEDDEDESISVTKQTIALIQ
jgi:hypothetical protein